MLQAIHIKNLITIDQLDLDFSSEWTVISGESGSGKSVFIQALGLLLGQRPQGRLLRDENLHADVHGIFDLQSLPEAQQWLLDNGFDQDEECVIRRRLYANGRSRAFINDTPVTQQRLQNLAPLLLQLHSQHAQQTLLKTSSHRPLLDAYANIEQLVKQCTSIYQNIQNIEHQINVISQDINSIPERRAELKIALDELKALNLKPNEYPELHQQFKSMNHMQTHQNAIQEIYQQIDAENGLLNSLQRMHHTMSSLITPKINNNVTKDDSIENELSQAIENIDQAHIHLNEVQQSLSNWLKDDHSQAETLQKIDERLSLLYHAARKYRIPPNHLSEHIHDLEIEYDALGQTIQLIKTLEKNKTDKTEQYNNIAKEVTAHRKTAAKSLGEFITAQLNNLSMTGSKFHVKLEPCSTDERNHKITPYGHENIRFFISTGAQAKPAPLLEVVSGGELSRISLALHLAAKELDTHKTWIFDEVDTGLSGTTAAQLAERISELSQKSQVLTVSHLPQMLAKAKYHYRFDKVTNQNGQQTTKAKALNHNERVNEIARLISHKNTTKESKEYAKQLLNLNVEA